MNKKVKKVTKKPKSVVKIHYVCMGGCGLVSEQRVKCASLGCVRNRNPLSECKCVDGKHSKIPKLNAGGFFENTSG